MARLDPPKPTGSELELLRVLWTRGPSTIGELHEAQHGRGTGYTTTLKVIQRMTEKGLVRRDESRRPHVYRAAVAAEKTQRQLVRDLLQRAFGGSASQLVVQALSEKPASAEELGEIRRLIESMERATAREESKSPKES